MNSRVSIYLDFLRVIAAFVVMFSHLSPFSGDVAPIFETFGHVAVVVFFVLSGYVIAFVADKGADGRGERDFNEFAARRLGRLYSVVVPALVLTFVLDHAGVRIAPDIYKGNTSFDHPLLRFFIHGFFLQEVWLTSVRFSSNGPLWSLSYEAFYYAIFAFAVLYEGRFKRAITAALCLIAGPTILIYGGVWMMGNAAYKIHRDERFKLNGGAGAALFVISLAGILSFPLWQRAVDFLPVFHKKLDFDKIATDFIFAGLVFGNIVAVKYLSFRTYLPLTLTLSPQGRGDKFIKFLAGLSFSLYAFHYPMMLFFGAVNERFIMLAGLEKFSGIAGAIFVLVYLLSFISERQKKKYAQWFKVIIGNIIVDIM